jgi:hypothetical protein
MIHGYASHRRSLQAKRLEVVADVGHAVAAAQFDEPDGLPVPIGILRKVVQLRDLHRSVRDACGTRAKRVRFTTVAEVRLRHRAVIQAKTPATTEAQSSGICRGPVWLR